ncbi:MAG: hypothetical protein HY691_05095 [Chloroflexi bacterium]|nr:hypothetical protein [Chloroflexota bacterium]
MPTTMVTNLLAEPALDLDGFAIAARRAVEQLQPRDDIEAQRLLASVRPVQAALAEPALFGTLLHSANAAERLPSALYPALLLARAAAGSEEADAYDVAASLWIAMTLDGQLCHLTTASDEGLTPGRALALRRDGTSFALCALADDAARAVRLAFAVRLLRDLRLALGRA